MRAIPFIAVLTLVLTLDLFVLNGKGTVVVIKSARQLSGAVVTTVTAALP
jgi:hypothetical protein